MKNGNIFYIGVLLLLSTIMYENSRTSEIILDRTELINFAKIEVTNNFKLEGMDVVNIEQTKTFPLNNFNLTLEIIEFKKNQVFNADVYFDILLNKDNSLRFEQNLVSINNSNNLEDVNLIHKSILQITEAFKNYEIEGFENKKVNYIAYNGKGDLVINYYEHPYQVYTLQIAIWLLFLMLILVAKELLRYTDIKFKKV